MNKKVIVITGAAGFLGSAITVALSQNHEITALDIRQPGSALVAATPGVKWLQVNIADSTSVSRSFQQVKADCSHIDFIIHLAAYYHFGRDWRKEYEQTNITGTENIVKTAINHGVRRILFASSIIALGPPTPGQILDENSPTNDYIPYAKSKSIGEKIIKDGSSQLPGIIIRFGGIFSDWCELPPLYSLIKLWSKIGLPGRIMPGKGESGFPYIHRSDAVQFVKRCISLHNQLDPLEIFLAAQNGAVYHKELFSVIKKTLFKQSFSKPISISPGIAKIGLFMNLALDKMAGKSSFEQPWMLDFIDLPMIADSSSTQRKLNWSCSPGKSVLDKLQIILKQYQEQRKIFDERNRLRNEGRYIYSD